MQLEERLYTSTEVADILGVSLRSVYRYLEESKIQADVKTATGRHRFSKQNILDFLYPNNANSSKSNDNSSQNVKTNLQPVKESRQFASVVTSTPQPDVPVEQTPHRESQPAQQQYSDEADKNTVHTPEQEEPVDWLAKFKAAAEKYKAEQASKVQPEPVKQAENDLYDMSSFKSPVVEETPMPVSKERYYKSFVGGLKDIAQALDKSSKKNSLDYAFTMNAGLSLHKPIKPFSILHAYVKSKDLDFYEKTLQLSPTSKENSQLCLIVSDDASLYNQKNEMHGLSVVSTSVLRKDLLNANEHDLVKELDNI